MLVDFDASKLKGLKPGDILQYDGKTVSTINRDELLKPVFKRLADLENTVKNQNEYIDTMHKELKDRQSRFISAFKGDAL